jgi:hypothetical protein
MSTPLKVGRLVTVLGCPPFFYLDCDRTSTFAMKRNVDVSSHVTREHLEAFWLVLRGGGQNVTLVKIIIPAERSHPPESVCGEQKFKG